MGLNFSPYVCTQTFGWCEDAIRGNRIEANNPLRWDEVVSNLPGSKDYQLGKPWFYRLCSKTGKLAAFFGTYIDDCQSGASTERGCWETSRRIAARTNYFGIQDASRKRRAPSKKPGAWAGSICLPVPGVRLFVRLGFVCDRGVLNGELHQVLRKIQSDRSDLIGQAVDIEDSYKKSTGLSDEVRQRVQEK